ncbi:hypothetical protein [Bradyrhizobium sp. ORS 285]|uniref:hypothetical protein n=1 Tax=Bradyrhizobium sp. ORS 285 TaxID=115808 RepID=UPI00055916A7|nr:hypothetical protein [Bradyrhizobium sp. ORS 285]
MALVAMIMFATTAAPAHQDRILSLGSDGTISGLPPAYQTTRLHVAFSNGDTGVLHELSFFSSGRETRLQPCLLRLVAKGSLRELFLTGSWDHEETIMPPYVLVEFRHPTPQQAPDPTSVRFLFSLRDSTLLGVTLLVMMPPSAKSPEDAADGPERRQAAIQFQPVSVLDGCPASAQ